MWAGQPQSCQASLARPVLPMIWLTVMATILRCPFTEATTRAGPGPFPWGPGIMAIVHSDSHKLCFLPCPSLPPPQSVFRPSLPWRHHSSRKPTGMSSSFLPGTNATCYSLLSPPGAGKMSCAWYLQSGLSGYLLGFRLQRCDGKQDRHCYFPQEISD